MGGAHLHVNEDVLDRSKANVIRYVEIIQGKTALLRTWEEKYPDDVDYIRKLKKKIRTAQVLLSHIK
jgi:hypothetical protein